MCIRDVVIIGNNSVDVYCPTKRIYLKPLPKITDIDIEASRLEKQKEDAAYQAKKRSIVNNNNY